MLLLFKKMFYKVELEEGEMVEKNIYIFDIIRTSLSDYDLEKYIDSIPIHDTDGKEKEEKEEEHSCPVCSTDGEGELVKD